MGNSADPVSNLSFAQKKTLHHSAVKNRLAETLKSETGISAIFKSLT